MKRFAAFSQAAVMAVVLLATVHCASDLSSALEQARFELDRENYSAAVTAAESALAADPGNVEATRILASALFGRSGMDFLDLARGMIDLDESDDPNFVQIANILPNPNSNTVSLDDLRTAITNLEALTGVDEDSISDEDLADATFDLALMQMVEHFALGVYNSDFYDGNDNTTVDVSGVTDAQRELVQADLVAFDGRIIASGVDASESFIREVRQTFCILEPISAGEGFTLAEYQALVGCQLSSGPDVFDTTALTADIANCAALEPNDDDACLDADTSL